MYHDIQLLFQPFFNFFPPLNCHGYIKKKYFIVEILQLITLHWESSLRSVGQCLVFSSRLLIRFCGGEMCHSFSFTILEHCPFLPMVTLSWKYGNEGGILCFAQNDERIRKLSSADPCQALWPPHLGDLPTHTTKTADSLHALPCQLLPTNFVSLPWRQPLVLRGPSVQTVLSHTLTHQCFSLSLRVGLRLNPGWILAQHWIFII